MPIVLGVNAVLPTAGAEEARLCAYLIVVDKTGEHVRHLIASRPGSATIAPAVAISAEEEIAFAGDGPEQIHLTPNQVRSKLERVVALYPAQAVGKLVSILWNRIEPVIAGVFELSVVAADECAAPSSGLVLAFGIPRFAEMGTLPKGGLKPKNSR